MTNATRSVPKPHDRNLLCKSLLKCKPITFNSIFFSFSANKHIRAFENGVMFFFYLRLLFLSFRFPKENVFCVTCTNDLEFVLNDATEKYRMRKYKY